MRDGIGYLSQVPGSENPMNVEPPHVNDDTYEKHFATAIVSTLGDTSIKIGFGKQIPTQIKTELDAVYEENFTSFAAAVKRLALKLRRAC